MKTRLQKIIASAGICSRRHAEDLILAGRVTVNGRVAALGDSANPDRDGIAVDGKLLAPEEKVYVLLNKPPGYECTLRSSHGNPTVLELVDAQARLFPVGRLDMDSRGLLVLTNDGDFANLLIHPGFGVDKEYLVRVEGAVAESHARKLAEGIELDDGPTRPCRVEVMGHDDGSTLLRFVLHEGRKRQIRRMLAALGHRVTDLRRLRIGKLTGGGLAEGQYREITPTELKELRTLAGPERETVR